jgi:hypothetical protein
VDIIDVLRLVARWWYVTVPVVLLSFGAAVVGTTGIQPEYRAEGSVLFVSPSVLAATDGSGDETRVNPLLVGSSGLTTAAEVASLAINTPQVAEILESEGLSSEFAVGSSSRSPILLIEARALSRATATATVLRVAELIEEDIALRQDAADAPENQRVTTSVISLSAVGGADYGGRMRIQVLVIVLGVALALALAFLLDGNRRRRTAGGQPGDENGDGEITDDFAWPSRSRALPASIDRSILTADVSEVGAPVDGEQDYAGSPFGGSTRSSR